MGEIEFDDADARLIKSFIDVMLAVLDRLGELDDKVDFIYRVTKKNEGL